MRKLLTLDAANYPPDLQEILRFSVRGIIFCDGKLLMIENNFGEVKLPGGGIEAGENDLDALVREVREETGYSVIRDSLIPFGEIEEKRLSDREMMVWHHFSRIYFCSVYPESGECTYTENEKKHGFRLVRYSVEEALERNGRMLELEGRQPWNQREYETLRLLKAYLDDGGSAVLR